jgi:CBS-domain-containing membrane protein
VEQAVHKRLDWARVYGEWFDIDQPALRQVVTEVRARTLLKHGVLEVNGVMMEDTIAIIAADENGEE